MTDVFPVSTLEAKYEAEKDILKKIVSNSTKSNIPIETTIALITDSSIEEIQKISKEIEKDNKR